MKRRQTFDQDLHNSGNSGNSAEKKIKMQTSHMLDCKLPRNLGLNSQILHCRLIGETQGALYPALNSSNVESKEGKEEKLDQYLLQEWEQKIIGPAVQLYRLWGYWSGPNGQHEKWERRIHEQGDIYDYITNITDILFRPLAANAIYENDLRKKLGELYSGRLSPDAKNAAVNFINDFLSNEQAQQLVCNLAQVDLTRVNVSVPFSAMVTAAQIIILISRRRFRTANEISKNFRNCLNDYLDFKASLISPFQDDE